MLTCDAVLKSYDRATSNVTRFCGPCAQKTYQTEDLREDRSIQSHSKNGRYVFHDFIKDNLPKGSVLELYTLDNRQRLVDYARQDKATYAAIVGHLPFSFFSQLEFPKPTLHLTILREPVSRLISYYHYVRSSQTHYLHDWVMGEEIGMHDFFLRKPTMEVDNMHVRFLCTTDCSNVQIGECTQAMLEEAKFNLKNSFDVVGLQEEFDKTMLLTASSLKWKRVTKPEINRNPLKPKRDQVPEETILLIKSLNELDIELYAFAKELFEERLQNQTASATDQYLSPSVRNVSN